MRDRTFELARPAMQKMLEQMGLCDAEYALWQEQFETLFASFKNHHQTNHALRREVINLIDACTGRDEYREYFSFFLGFQMGFDLGSFDPFPRH